MFCSLADLKTESDVEQKLLWPMLTTMYPTGLGYSAADVLTKHSIRRLEVGKGTHRKLYFPDYMVVLAGLPVLVIEAKAPGEAMAPALDEARLYASEINALFPSGTNPCVRVVACNGLELWSAPVDTATPDIQLVHSQMSPAGSAYGGFVTVCQRAALQTLVDRSRRTLRPAEYRRAANLLGGSSVQNEELPPNTFGATIVGDYGHIFSPRTRADRALVVRQAYVPSLRRTRYVEPLDRLIRAAVSPSVTAVKTFEDTSKPLELTRALTQRKNLENQVLLLIGSVGSGKSTFVDYVSLVALPEDLRERTVWVRVNLNEAPLSADTAYRWMAEAISDGLRDHLGNGIDTEELATLQKIFAPELNSFKKGAIALLAPSSPEYLTRLTDELIRLQSDKLTFAKCLARFVCAGPGKLLVVVLDNCDKRTRDEQLTMFQVAQWVQTEFRGLVVLPLRDVTYERHRHEPPLDTFLKGLVFRIEPPQFTDVLQARVRLALDEMHGSEAASQTLSYVLPNGMRVTYPASDQAKYLASILRSLYEHDKFVRKVMTGLAGRDVRKALEIFLDFCTSGHIGEDEIYRIRFHEGRHVLPLSVVARILLRMQRRYYDGATAYIKNVVQCDLADALPDHFVRLSVLHWLEQRQSVQGPAGIKGFHSVQSLIRDLVQLGHDATRVRKDLQFLIREGCVVPEHLRMDDVNDNDLLTLTASGLVHLQLMASPDYLAACAEDTWVADPELAERVASRIASRGMAGHFSPLTTAKNAHDFVDYLKRSAAERVSAPETYLEPSQVLELKTLREAEAAIAATDVDVSTRLYVRNVPFEADEEQVRKAFELAGIPPKEVVLPSSPSGRNRGYAFVEMTDSRAAIAALDSAGLQISGRRLLVAEAQRPKPFGESASRRQVVALSERLYVGNLRFNMDQKGVMKLFHDHDFQPTDVYVPLDRTTSMYKGYAFVSMSSQTEAEAAIGALNGSVVETRSIVVRPAEQRSARSAQSPP